MNMPIGCDTERVIEASGRNDRLPAAARQVRHRAAACLAECGCEASRLGQVEARDGGLPAQPSKGRGPHDHLAGMRRPCRLSAPRAVAVEEVIERSLDLERDLAAEAAPPNAAIITSSNLPLGPTGAGRTKRSALRRPRPQQRNKRRVPRGRAHYRRFFRFLSCWSTRLCSASALERSGPSFSVPMVLPDMLPGL
jgi:hypothetical protein